MGANLTTYPNASAEAAESIHGQTLIGYLSQFARVSEAEAEAILALAKVRTYAKGHVLLREGQRGDTCYFVLKGCIREYYLVDGLEKTTQFFTEGQPVTTTGVPFENMASKSYLVCLEDCVLMAGSPEDAEQFFEQIPLTQTINRVSAEFELRKSQEALAEFIISSPEERYLNLMKNRSDLLERVPQYHLASYLGITPESLSRIRRRITMR
jgi:cAMP-binding proteins - catabolite gene activator and regulatory subunit of cAMP-dependent protein kinases